MKIVNKKVKKSLDKLVVKVNGGKIGQIEYIFNNWENTDKGIFITNRQFNKKVTSDFISNTKLSVIKDSLITHDNGHRVSLKLSLEDLKGWIKYVEKRKKDMSKHFSKIETLICHPTPDICLYIKSNKKKKDKK
jgi:hypothetical protein